MGMFGVKKNTKGLVIKKGKEWHTKNFINHSTKEDNWFHKGELIIDPTGISKYACVPNCVSVGSSYAGAGYYGFEREGWYLLVPAKNVEYA